MTARTCLFAMTFGALVLGGCAGTGGAPGPVSAPLPRPQTTVAAAIPADPSLWMPAEAQELTVHAHGNARKATTVQRGSLRPRLHFRGETAAR